MSDQIILYKPVGTEVPAHILAKIQKDYTCPNVFTCYHIPKNKKWIYNEKHAPVAMKGHESFAKEAESFIMFVKSQYFMPSAPMTHYRNKGEDHESWFVTMGHGTFPFLIAANDKGPDVIFENFSRFLDTQSLHGFLTNLCSNNAISYASITSSGARRYGKWVDLENGLMITNADSIYKLEYRAKDAARAIIAYSVNPQSFNDEFKRLEKLSDFELRKEIERVPGLPEIIQKIS